ncbi:hypothetical protein D3C81_2032950 [compost metagenome]
MFDLNQAKGLASASWLVTVGDRRASMGEPMKVMEAGRFGSFSAAMTAQAASTGGPGWQTPTTWARGPMALSMARTWSM